MPDFGIFRGFGSKLFSDKLYAGQLPTQLGLIGSESFGFVGLLDDYPNAAAAYSLRKLRRTYTGNAIKVRNSSNSELDIGFVNNELDTASLLTHCGSGDGFVTTWYDQSGNGKNATQATAANQPQIVSSGSVITTNSKPSLLFDGSNDLLTLTSLTPASNQSIYGVGKRNSNGAVMSFIGSDLYSFGSAFLYFSDNLIYYLGNTAVRNSATTNTSLNLQLVNGYLVSGFPTAIYRNGALLTTLISTGSLTQSYNNIGKYGNSFSNCNFSEIIYYESDQLANNSGIQNNINGFYSIY